MDKVEQIVNQFLINKFGNPPIFEPNGNRTPDFEINDIAVEARLFDLNGFQNGKRIALNDVDINIKNCTDEVLSNFSNYESNPHYRITVFYKRPITKYKKFKKCFLDILTRVQSDKPTQLFDEKINENIIIRFEPIPMKDKLFELELFYDIDKFGFLIPNFCQSLESFIKEKSQKMKKFINEYQTWWLVLYYPRNSGFEPQELLMINNSKIANGSFDKIIVIDKHLKSIIELSK